MHFLGDLGEFGLLTSVFVKSWPQPWKKRGIVVDILHVTCWEGVTVDRVHNLFNILFPNMTVEMVF